ncbi:MAG: acyltransferase [Thermodesulfobacteriota bacterium]|nr:acyltransferase [Thermodesulfobacteriota bacterium]
MNTSILIRKYLMRVGNIIRTIRIAWLRLAGVGIGKKCMISMGAKIDTRRGNIIIGDNSVITHGCVLLSHDGATKRMNTHKTGTGTIRIGENVFIGVNTVVMPDVTIGENSIVGAGSVVTKSIPAGFLYAGNPAKEIKKLDLS